MKRSCFRRTSTLLVLHSTIYLTCAIGIALGAATFAHPRLARADDLFEIEVFHVRVNEPLQFGTELHSNYVVSSAARPDPAAALAMLACPRSKGGQRGGA